jgi:AcrR family transcriptional regulator
MPGRQEVDHEPGSLRAEQVAATRRAIVASARQLFGSRGYAATSVDDIARNARVTKGAVYHHFDTKNDVFRAVYREVEDEARARTGAAAAAATGSAVDLIVAGAHGYLDATLDAEVQRITLIDAPSVLGPTPDGSLAEDPGHVAMREFIAAAIDAGQIAAVDPDALAHLISGSLLQSGLVIARSEDPAAMRSRLGATLEAMIRGLDPRGSTA